VLDAYLFGSLAEVRSISEQWLSVYNEQRPHEALGSLPPAVFRANVIETQNSNHNLST
jgi:putative transposase